MMDGRCDCHTQEHPLLGEGARGWKGQADHLCFLSQHCLPEILATATGHSPGASQGSLSITDTHCTCLWSSAWGWSSSGWGEHQVISHLLLESTPFQCLFWRLHTEQSRWPQCITQRGVQVPREGVDGCVGHTDVGAALVTSFAE